MVFCKNCGHELSESDTNCSRCGTSISHDGNAMQDTRVLNYKNSSKKTLSKHYHIVMGIIAILLGSFGVHKYLMGRRFIWILYFAFCWTFIPTIVGIVEGICYLVNSEENFEKKYLYKKNKK